MKEDTNSDIKRLIEIDDKLEKLTRDNINFVREKSELMNELIEDDQFDHAHEILNKLQGLSVKFAKFDAEITSIHNIKKRLDSMDEKIICIDKLNLVHQKLKSLESKDLFDIAEILMEYLQIDQIFFSELKQQASGNPHFIVDKIIYMDMARERLISDLENVIEDQHEKFDKSHYEKYIILFSKLNEKDKGLRMYTKFMSDLLVKWNMDINKDKVSASAEKTVMLTAVVKNFAKTLQKVSEIISDSASFLSVAFGPGEIIYFISEIELSIKFEYETVHHALLKMVEDFKCTGSEGVSQSQDLASSERLDQKFVIELLSAVILRMESFNRFIGKVLMRDTTRIFNDNESLHCETDKKGKLIDRILCDLSSENYRHNVIDLYNDLIKITLKSTLDHPIRSFQEGKENEWIDNVFFILKRTFSASVGTASLEVVEHTLKLYSEFLCDSIDSRLQKSRVNFDSNTTRSLDSFNSDISIYVNGLRIASEYLEKLLSFAKDEIARTFSETHDSASLEGTESKMTEMYKLDSRWFSEKSLILMKLCDEIFKSYLNKLIFTFPTYFNVSVREAQQNLLTKLTSYFSAIFTTLDECASYYKNSFSKEDFCQVVAMIFGRICTSLKEFTLKMKLSGSVIHVLESCFCTVAIPQISNLSGSESAMMEKALEFLQILTILQIDLESFGGNIIEYLKKSYPELSVTDLYAIKDCLDARVS